MTAGRLRPQDRMILEDFRAAQPLLKRMKDVVLDILRNDIADKGLMVTGTEARIKTEESLAGKLERKGGKYASLSEITDLLGARVITFYSDDVDKIAAMVENLFDIDWDNSVDKRKMHELDSFGYNSLHYICRIPESLYSDPAYPEMGEIRFEIQIRTALQHAWATINHDSGYKSGIEIPREYLRDINRLAGLLELADEQFCRIRSNITSYRRRVHALVAEGQLDEVLLDGDTFKSYLDTRPFDRLNERIAAINQAEIQEVSLLPFLPVLKGMGLKTLGDVDKMVRACEEKAFRQAVYQLGVTDIDIITSSVALQNICIVRILEAGAGRAGLRMMFDALYGPSQGNDAMAGLVLDQAKELKIN